MPNTLRWLMIALMAAGGAGGMFGAYITAPQPPAPRARVLMTTPLFEALAARATVHNALRRHGVAQSRSTS